MIELPTTLADINALIQGGIQEDVHLDYKESRAIDRGKKDEIAKDVSAFANSDGGLIIYGITEDNNLPVRIDGGVDHNRCTREWLEQIIASNVTPRIDGIRISVIPLSPERSIYAVKIPRSVRGPHQSADKKYYKRFNFQSAPMEDYEINDVRNRSRTVPPLISIGLEVEDSSVIYVKVGNAGHQTAEDVKFTWSSGFQLWIDENSNSLFTRGIKQLAPGSSYRFEYGYFEQVFHNEKRVSEFEITAMYLHPETGQYITDIFQFDLMDYWNTSLRQSEHREIGWGIKDSINKLTEQVKQLNNHLQKIAWITSPTGLEISVTSLRNLKHLQSPETQIEKFDPKECTDRIFKEVLGVNREMAHRISHFFRFSTGSELKSIEGMTEELEDKIKKYFRLDKDK